VRWGCRSCYVENPRRRLVPWWCLCEPGGRRAGDSAVVRHGRSLYARRHDIATRWHCHPRTSPTRTSFPPTTTRRHLVNRSPHFKGKDMEIEDTWCSASWPGNLVAEALRYGMERVVKELYSLPATHAFIHEWNEPYCRCLIRVWIVILWLSFLSR